MPTMKHYSHTKLEEHEACPLMFKRKRIDKIAEKRNYPMQMGSLAHDFKARYDRHLQEKMLETDITVVPDMVRDTFLNPEEPHTLPMIALDELMAICEKSAATHIFNPYTTVAIEEMWKIPILNGTKLFWAKIDKLEIEGDTATVVDYKSDWRVRSRAELEKDPQLRRYAWCTRMQYPQVKRVQARLEFIRHGVIPDPIDLDVEDMTKAEQEILGGIYRIENTVVFEATPGDACSWCGYSEFCTVPKEAAKAGQIIVTTPEEAQRIVGELAVLEKQVADRKAALKPFCVKQGNVATNGLEWGFWTVDSKGFNDVPAFKRIMTEAGRDPDPYMTVDNKKAKPLLNEPDLGPKLAAVVTNKPYTKFDSKKLKGGEK